MHVDSKQWSDLNLSTTNTVPLHYLMKTAGEELQTKHNNKSQHAMYKENVSGREPERLRSPNCLQLVDMYLHRFIWQWYGPDNHLSYPNINKSFKYSNSDDFRASKTNDKTSKQHRKRLLMNTGMVVSAQGPAHTYDNIQYMHDWLFWEKYFILHTYALR